MKRTLSIGLVLFVLLASGTGVVWQQYQRFLQTPLLVGPSGLVFNVEAGSHIRSVVMDLEEQAVTQLDWRWKLLSRLQVETIKTGEYLLPPGILPSQLLKLLASGTVVTYRFTIVEGWAVKQLVAALGEDPVLQHTIDALAELENVAGLPDFNPEGWFLPETYVFVRGDTDLNILQRAYQDMQKALSDTWAGRDTGLPYETPDELLTMASIVEKETSMDSERADIAGVFVRRLKKRWRLETDPTVIYGMGDSYQGNIRRRDLKQDTPYNTYTRHGLPPTPIALPGLAALQAAAHPANGDVMFFVANGQGGHTFSITLDEHNKAVKQLIKRNTNTPTDTGKKE